LCKCFACWSGAESDVHTIALLPFLFIRNVAFCCQQHGAIANNAIANNGANNWAAYLRRLYYCITMVGAQAPLFTTQAITG